MVRIQILSIVPVPVSPRSSVTVNVALNVPPVLYEYDGFGSVELPPSPKVPGITGNHSVRIIGVIRSDTVKVNCQWCSASSLVS